MLTEMRIKERKTFERRINDRRQADFEFNSSQWVKHIKKNYAAWPKIDRRIANRRDHERRNDEQGVEISKNSNNDYSSDLLTNEERLYFDELFTLKDKQ